MHNMFERCLSICIRVTSVETLYIVILFCNVIHFWIVGLRVVIVLNVLHFRIVGLWIVILSDMFHFGVIWLGVVIRDYTLHLRILRLWVGRFVFSSNSLHLRVLRFRCIIVVSANSLHLRILGLRLILFANVTLARSFQILTFLELFSMKVSCWECILIL